MLLEDAIILSHEHIKSDYKLLRLQAPNIVSQSKPGQFVQLRIPTLEPSALRRPFSICNAEDGVLTILYKNVGRGTNAMTSLQVGTSVNIMGPLGSAFPILKDFATTPLLVAGGFGVAPLYFYAKKCQTKGTLFVGGRSESDILITEMFEKIGWNVEICTNDGSLGTKGFVTAALNAWQSAHAATTPYEIFACGPEPMLKALDDLAISCNVTAWLSLDRRMACGVGACLGCIQKIRENGEIKIIRVCKEGPIFKSNTIVWED